MITPNFDYIPQEGRQLPISLKFRVFFSSPIFWIGLMFTLICLIVFPILLLNFNFKSLKMSNNFPTTEGKIDKVYIQSTSGRGRNGNQLGTFYFTYTHSNGQSYKNVSYLRAKKEDLTNLSYTEKCTVHYSPEDPGLACIEGMSMTSIPLWSFLLVLPFLLVGFFLAVKGIRKGIRSIHLLRFGILGQGTFLRQEDTGMIINNRHVYKLFFELKANDGNTYEVSSSTSRPEKLQDEAFEKLVYDAANPADAVLIDSLPKVVKNYFSTT
jgi:hypothetical protein